MKAISLLIRQTIGGLQALYAIWKYAEPEGIAAPSIPSENSMNGRFKVRGKD